MNLLPDDLAALDRESLIAIVLEQRAAIAEYRSQLEALRAEIAELRARLNQNSKNSSKPPSTDSPFTKMRPNATKGGGKTGGQPGHEGHGLKKVAQPDRDVVHSPDACSHCGCGLAGVEMESIGTWQVFDLPADLKIEVTAHSRSACFCPRCKKRTEASLPAWLSEQTPCQWGPGCRAWAVYLIQQQHIPFERTQAMFIDLFGMAPSEGTLFNWLKEAYETLEPVEAAICEALVNSDCVGADETTARGAGWLHTLVNKDFTWYGCHKKRGREAMDSFGLLPRFKGLLMTDCLGSYTIYGGQRSLCNAHLLRDLSGVRDASALALETGHHWPGQMTGLLIAIKKRVEAAGGTPLPRSALNGVYRRYGRILSLAAQENSLNPVAKSCALLYRLNERRDEYFRFATTAGAWFDNNLSENSLRMTKLHVKISGCFRSEVGCKILCRVRGYLSTMRKQGQPLFAALRSVMERSPMLPPSLAQLPT